MFNPFHKGNLTPTQLRCNHTIATTTVLEYFVVLSYNCTLAKKLLYHSGPATINGMRWISYIHSKKLLMNRLAVGRSARAQQAHEVDNRIDRLHKVDNTHPHIHTPTHTASDGNPRSAQSQLWQTIRGISHF